MKIFDKGLLKKLHNPDNSSKGEDNGQITIVGGSELFHGAPIFALKSASRFVDMVFFATPDKSVGSVAEKLKSQLSSFIWIPWVDTPDYIKKSDAILIGPGFMRFGSEKTTHGERAHSCDAACMLTRKITLSLFEEFPKKQWVVDAGSLQVIEAGQIPKKAIITPNFKEYEMLFSKMEIKEAAKKYKCIIVLKGPETLVASSKEIIKVTGGNGGMTKGGTGDVMAGLTVALAAKNDSFLAASSAAFITKAAGDDLFKKVGPNFNADDLANQIPETLFNLQK